MKKSEMEDFNKPKIVWKRIGSILRFSYDTIGCFALDSTCFATGTHLKYLVAILNSKMGNYLLKDAPKTGDLLISVQAVEPIRVPLPNIQTEIIFEKILEKVIENGATQSEGIDKKTYELYGLTEKEIDFIESF